APPCLRRGSLPGRGPYSAGEQLVGGESLRGAVCRWYGGPGIREHLAPVGWTVLGGHLGQADRGAQPGHHGPLLGGELEGAEDVSHCILRIPSVGQRE